MARRAHLYFHSPCFDGVISSVIASDFLEASAGWKIEKYCPVDYGLRTSWLATDLGSPAAAVDFLYHPQATFWADHHATTFVTPLARDSFERRKQDRWLIYDDAFGSCARLLSERLTERFGFHNARYQPMVDWAEKIDAARYTSVSEAILGDAPALKIRASIGFYEDPAYFERLVKELKTKSLDEVALLPEVADAAAQVQSRAKTGLQLFAAAARLEDGEIVVFDVKNADAEFSRYAPYYFFPQARYSVGIVRSHENAKITGMRNPWLEFPSVPLGSIFEKYGGGGHQRVAALLLPRDAGGRATAILQCLLSDIRAADVLQHRQPSHA